MADISKQQIKSIYALGASLGIVEHGVDSHNDDLHQLVEAVTGKKSVSQLSSHEASQVIANLIHRMRGFPEAPPARKKAKKYEETPGGMTAGQQRKVWELMYELRKFDREENESSLGKRLCGIIKRQFRMDASIRNPFRFLSWEQGRQLIEILKKYCTSAEMKYIREGGAG